MMCPDLHATDAKPDPPALGIRSISLVPEIDDRLVVRKRLHRVNRPIVVHARELISSIDVRHFRPHCVLLRIRTRRRGPLRWRSGDLLTTLSAVVVRRRGLLRLRLSLGIALSRSAELLLLRGWCPAVAVLLLLLYW